MARDGVPGGTEIAAAEAALADAADTAQLWRLQLQLSFARARAGDAEAARRHRAGVRRLLEAELARLDEPMATLLRARPDVRDALLATAAPTDSAPDAPSFLAQLLSLNERLALETDPQRLLETILDVAIEMSGAERGFVLTPASTDARPGEVTVRVARDFDRERLPPEQLEFSRTIATEVLITSQPLISVDAMDDDRLRDNRSVHAMRLRSVLCVPMRYRGRALGVVYVDNRLLAGAFDRGRQAFMEGFADQAAIALARADQLRVEQEAREALEAARAEVERLNRQLETRLERQTEGLVRAQQQLRRQHAALQGLVRDGGIVGDSAPMKRVLALVDRVAPTRVPVLVVGESGTGKELIARALHLRSDRASEHLLAINCAALPETLLESELFGHVRGAFTGADRDRAGLFERADRGTLFLDEVGDMTLTMQAKLLRALDSGQIRRVGSTSTRRVDVRVVAATNRDLEQGVADGRFREDLYYRLCGIQLKLPPLRDRGADVLLLAEHFLTRIGADATVRRLSAAARRRLQTYSWPGNVRELQSALTAAALLAPGDRIEPEDLPLSGSAPPAPARWDGLSTLAEIEVEVIRDALERLGGNKSRAARALGIDRNTLRTRLERADRA